jgi:anti-sigma regulatory factor (Ser/Thr protein kinase)
MAGNSHLSSHQPAHLPRRRSAMTSIVSASSVPTPPPSTGPWLHAVKNACLLAGSRQDRTPPSCARHLLPPDATAAGLARTILRTTLATHGVASTAFDEIEVVVSELVTNALRHALPAVSSRQRGTHPQLLITLHRSPHLLVMVTDPSDKIPTPLPPTSHGESGRGLHLIQALSDAWGWAPLTQTGKAVWAGFTTPRDGPA